MIKKALVLAAAGLFSLNASAGYVQYDFNGPVYGHVIQHDDDQSIAFYDLHIEASVFGSPAYLSFHPIFGEGADVITAETTYFHKNGPTNLNVFSDYGGDKSYGVSVIFSRATGGNFAYTAEYDGSTYMDIGQGGKFYPVSGSLTGIVSKGVVPAGMIHLLDDLGGYYDGVPKITPKYVGPAAVPEPATLALFGVGALGAGIAARRKSKAHRGVDEIKLDRQVY